MTATPICNRVTGNLQLSSTNAQTVQFLTATTATPPVPINISSGWGGRLLISPTQAGAGFAPIDISGIDCTKEYLSTGYMTLTWPYQGLNGSVPTASGTYQAQMSTDGGTTFFTISSGTYQFS